MGGPWPDRRSFGAGLAAAWLAAPALRAQSVGFSVDVLSRFETVCLDFRRDEVGFRLPVDRA
jgi:hypothetical protein